MVAVAFVEGELSAVAYALEEVGVALLGVWQFVDDLLHIGDGALEALIYLALRSFDVGHLALALEAFALEDDLAAVGIGIGDVPPDAYCVGMLLRSVNLHFDGELVVLAEQVLHGVDVVLTHVGQSAAVVVEVSSEGLVCAVYVVGLVGSRAEPEVVVQFLGHGLYLKVFLTNPEELPCEACCAGDAHFERPSEQSALDELLERLHFCAESVERILEAEPGVETEHAGVALHGFFHTFAFADGACHGFLAEDVLSGIGSFDGHDAVPMGWGGNVDDVNTWVVDELAEVVISFHLVAPLLLGSSDGGVKVFLVNVAKCHESAALVAGEVVAGATDAAHADQASCQLVTGGDVVVVASHLA